MSYSICLQCKDVVRRHEKYCDLCAKDKRENDLEFLRTHGYEFLNEPQRSQELKKDKKDQKEQK